MHMRERPTSLAQIDDTDVMYAYTSYYKRARPICLFALISETDQRICSQRSSNVKAPSVRWHLDRLGFVSAGFFCNSLQNEGFAPTHCSATVYAESEWKHCLNTRRATLNR